MVEHWSSCLSGMQFSTKDQVGKISHANNCKFTDNVQMTTVVTLMMVMITDRTMTATFRAVVLRRIKQDGGSTGESFQIK